MKTRVFCLFVFPVILSTILLCSRCILRNCVSKVTCHALLFWVRVMSLHLRSLASRLWNAFPSLSRSINSRAASTPVPPSRDPSILTPQVLRPNYHLESIKSPADFLKAIGRSCESKISVESWEEFWKKDGLLLRKDGVSVRDRR